MQSPDSFLAQDTPVPIDLEATVRKIRFLVQTHHVTVPDLEHDLGIRVKTLQNVLDGESRPSGLLLERLASYFGVTVEFLTGAKAAAMEDTLSPSAAQGHGHGGGHGGGASRASPLGLADVAVRLQAMVELLVEKGVCSGAEYHSAVERVKERLLQR
ncbi:MAG: helix-turn-helix domain-containing protein [Planctomycetes bacterium]|nr:helix-turn-helix domain-containing protein [Planctomycetota bacterium]